MGRCERGLILGRTILQILILFILIYGDCTQVELDALAVRVSKRFLSVRASNCFFFFFFLYPNLSRKSTFKATNKALKQNMTVIFQPSIYFHFTLYCSKLLQEKKNKEESSAVISAYHKRAQGTLVKVEK